MNAKTKTIVWIAVLAVFIAASAVAYGYLSARTEAPDALAPAEEAAPEENRLAAPDFTVLTADGGEVKLSEMRGKPVVINFWASWCPPCVSEMPEFDKVHAELGGEISFMMIDLADGIQETQETGAAFIAEQGFGFPVYFDTTGEAATYYGVSAIPSTVFIDSEGYVITGARGAINEETLRRGIEQITPKAD